ncbi:hypothetical protein EXIGLDRAFT_753857 [Exidia glandulosa HHB12029]|uniref:Uncharacterized protein n=1 Tax=Exidia glandulosa HHB12029 TaxID=1314781 RepID=A0A165DF34_EXIGL|nr:hypothetical protein EXIGLDRAFT_753857 [Exidia glandulosa HHB12029]
MCVVRTVLVNSSSLTRVLYSWVDLDIIDPQTARTAHLFERQAVVAGAFQDEHYVLCAGADVQDRTRFPSFTVTTRSDRGPLTQASFWWSDGVNFTHNVASVHSEHKHATARWITGWYNHEVANNGWKAGMSDGNDSVATGGCAFLPSLTYMTNRKIAAVRAHHDRVSIPTYTSRDLTSCRRVLGSFRFAKLRRRTSLESGATSGLGRY